MGFRGQVQGRRDRRLRVVLCPRGDPEPLRAVQRADQVLRAVGPRARAGLRRRRHRPLRAAVGRPAAARRRPRQGPVLRARCADRRAAAPCAVPDRRHPQAADPRGGRAPRPGRRREARQPRHLLHPVRRHPGVPREPHRRAPRHGGGRRRHRAGRTRRRARLHRSASARDSASPALVPTGAPAM